MDTDTWCRSSCQVQWHQIMLSSECGNIEPNLSVVQAIPLMLWFKKLKFKNNMPHSALMYRPKWQCWLTKPHQLKIFKLKKQYKTKYTKFKLTNMLQVPDQDYMYTFLPSFSKSTQREHITFFIWKGSLVPTFTISWLVLHSPKLWSWTKEDVFFQRLAQRLYY